MPVTPVLLLGLSTILVAGCTQNSSPTATTIAVSIFVDGKALSADVTGGTTVQSALEKAGVTMNNLDKVDPPSYTALYQKTTINITRVREEFEVEDKVIAFPHQTVRNESLPEGQTLLIQPGVNGVQEITYRRVFENNIETSRTVYKTETLKEAKPEIVMIGIQSPFMPVPILGKIVYLSAGNAWMMEENTGNRFPLVTSGDLDGRIFSLSPDGNWLLFTRKAEGDPSQRINTLWVVSITGKIEPIDLKAKNIVNYAGWVPNLKRSVAYSTVEPRSTPPGWQANNDLFIVSFDEEGNVMQAKQIVEANDGGIYGWWGTTFSWSPDGKRVAYARPDSVGLVDLTEGKLIPLIDLIPFQTHSEWAWVPGLSWSADHRVLYIVTHAPKAGLVSDEASPLFDITALVPENGLAVSLIQQTGMFAYPIPSPITSTGRYMVAYLQAIFPEQSQTTRYSLMIIDRDGSNRKAVFPPEGSPGIEPQEITWGPIDSENNLQVAVIYQGNLWLINPDSGQTHQITGDNTISRLDWK